MHLFNHINELIMILNKSNILLIKNVESVNNLIIDILNIIMPLIMAVSFAIAMIFTAITFMSGYEDLNGLERKQKIKRLIWIWVCCGGVFATSTIMYCLRSYFVKLSGI